MFYIFLHIVFLLLSFLVAFLYSRKKAILEAFKRDIF